MLFDMEYHAKPRTRAAGAENIAAIAPDKPLRPEGGGYIRTLTRR
jgi:hypothetical protein